MVFGIDIDDTISDTTEKMFNLVQKFIVEDLKREPLIDEVPIYTHHVIETIHGLSEEEFTSFLVKYYRELTEGVIPKTFSVEYLKKLKDEGNKIVLITARIETTDFDVKKSTEEWLKKYDIPYDKLIINAKTKLKAAQEEKVDVFIDDSFMNCSDVSKSGIKAYLMDSRGNRGLNPEGFERIYSWPHLYYKLHNNI